MNPRDVLRISAGALSAHKVRSRLTMAAVAVGVASVLLLTALGESAQDYVVGQFAGIGSNLLFVEPGKVETMGGPHLLSGTTRPLTLEDAEALRRGRTVVDVAPVSVGMTTANAGSRGRNVIVIGATPAFVPMRRLEIRAGENLPGIDPGKTAQVCVIGSRVARELFGGETPLGKWIRLGERRFRVIGLLSTKGRSLGVDIDEMVLVPVGSVMQMVNRRGLFRIVVQLRSYEQMEAAKREIRKILVERHGAEDFTLISQQSVVDSLKDILGLLTAAVTAIAAISLGVAGIGIMNVMLISVVERTQEIGLAKALGASRGQVRLVFLAEAAMLSLIGGAAGVAAGFVGAEVVEMFVPELPMRTPVWAIEAALLVALGVGIMFGVLPAAKAARMPPVEALRGKV